MNQDLQDAIKVLDGRHNELKEVLLQRYAQNIDKIEAKFKELPDWAQSPILQRKEADKSFLLAGYFEWVHAATEGIDLAKQFPSASSWKSFMENPNESLIQPKISAEHTEETFKLMVSFANEYVRRNYPEIVIAS